MMSALVVLFSYVTFLLDVDEAFVEEIAGCFHLELKKKNNFIYLLYIFANYQIGVGCNYYQASLNFI